jgi:ubiquinone/menaquinone biosynthesis C-methylase UbiE
MRNGVASAYIAKKYNCRVVRVDLSEKMIEWSWRRAKEVRVEDKVEFRVADVLELPFDADRFDIVLCESVLVPAIFLARLLLRVDCASINPRMILDP